MKKQTILKHLNFIEEFEGIYPNPQLHHRSSKILKELGYIKDIEVVDGYMHLICHGITEKGYFFLKENKTN